MFRHQRICLPANRVKRVKAGNELKIVASQLAEALEGSLRLSSQLSGHNTEQVRFDSIGIQQCNRARHLVPCSLPSGVHPVQIMVLPRAVQRDSHEKRVRFEKRSPFFVQTDPIGLDTVEHGDLALHGAFRFQKEPKKIKSGKGRFAALKQKMDAAAVFCGGKGFFDQFFCHFV